MRTVYLEDKNAVDRAEKIALDAVYEYIAEKRETQG